MLGYPDHLHLDLLQKANNYLQIALRNSINFWKARIILISSTEAIPIKNLLEKNMLLCFYVPYQNGETFISLQISPTYHTAY